MGLTTPETERVVIPKPEPLQLPVQQPEAEPAPAQPVPLEPSRVGGATSSA
jgi:hypothetical protein